MMQAGQVFHSRAAWGLLGIIVLAALELQPARADETPSAPRKVTTVEGITEYVLNNGLHFLLFPDDSASKVTVNCTVFVGSRQEGYGETGMAHLLEHMLFKGTPTHPHIPKLLRDRGADFNGTTWMDRTNYHETLDATDDNLEFAIRLEADRLVNSFVKREDLASEMTVVRSEFEMNENNPETILSQRMVAIAFEWHNYGKTTIGNRSDIERVPIDKLQAFYRKYYQPDNAMLIVAGKFKPEKALAYISKYFGPLKKPRRVLDDTYTDEPTQDGERSVALRRVGSVAAVGAVYHIPAGPQEDVPAIDVLSTLLEMQPSGRLYKALVEDSKKATSVSANTYALHDPGYLEILIKVDKNANVEEVRQGMLDTIDEVCKGPISEEEVARARRKVLNQYKELLDRSNRVGTALSDWAAMGDWRLLFIHRDRVAKVTAEDVQRVARHYLLRSNRTVGLFFPTTHPHRSIIPATPNVETLVKNYESKETIAQGEGFDPTVANLEKRTQYSRLNNGVKVALLPFRTRGERAKLTLVLHFGNAESLKDNTMAAQLLGPLLRRGTRKHTRQQLQDILDKLEAHLTVSSEAGDLTCSIDAKHKDLPAVLELLTEVLREPAFPANEFEILKRQVRSTLESMRTEPQGLAARKLQRKLAPYPSSDVRYVPTLEESIARVEKVTVEDVRRLYSEQLGGQNGELAVVGDFAPEETAKLVEKGLADWKASVDYQRIARPVPEGIKPERISIETPDKQNAIYFAALLFALRDDDPDNAALEVADYLFGGGPLSSRLADRVRQKEGLSYGVGSRYGADAQDRRARMLLYAICNPANMEKVDRAILEEMERFVKHGVETKELDEAKKAYLAAMKQQRTQEEALAHLLQSELQVGRKTEYLAELEKKVANLTVEEVNSAITRHIDPKKLVIVEAGDFHKKSEKKQ